MADEGNFKLWRRFFDHPYWLEARVFSRAEAWIDLIAMASFRDRERMVGAMRVKLVRGEFIASVRYLATRWSWGRHKVHDFMQGAIDAGELTKRASTRKGDTYLVANYDRYQVLGDTEGTERGQSRSKGSKGITDVIPVEPSKNGSRGKDTWLTPYALPWTEATGGEPAYGVLAKFLRPLVKKHGEAETLQAWKTYLRTTDPQFISAASFASKIGHWLKQSIPHFNGYG